MERGIPRDRALLLGAFAVLIVGTMFLPWSRTGASVRSGYALAHAVEEAGLVTTAPAHVLLDAVFFLPVAVGLACGALLLKFVRTAAILVALSGSIAAIASVVVLSKFHTSAEIGPWLEIVMSGFALTLSVVLTLRKREIHA